LKTRDGTNPPTAGAVVCAIGLTLLATLTGCPRQSTRGDYKILTGTVQSVNATERELTILIEPSSSERTTPGKLACLLTSDAEVYVDDVFSGVEAVEIGDTVRLVGYVDTSPQAKRFVVSKAEIERNEPLPDPPDLSPPTTIPPTSQAKES